MAMGMQVTATGPLFDGRAEQAVGDFATAAEQHVGDIAVNRIHQQLGSVLQHPTGAYESNVVTDRQRDDLAVTDSKSVYGPWLEGVEERNQTTRFKGYRTFRIVGQDLADEAGKLAEQVLPPYLEQMQ